MERPFDLSLLASSSGASYVARWTVAHPTKCIKSLKDGIRKNGFSFIEILSPCLPQYGRRNEESLEDLHEMFRSFKAVYGGTIPKEVYEDEKRESKHGYVLGVLRDEEGPEFTDQMRRKTEIRT